MIPQISEINFPEYATLSQASVTLNDMGDRTISTQVKIEGNITPDFSYDWEIEFKGERYIQPLRQPQAGKNNESRYSTIDLTFYHKTIWQLKRYYFVEMTSTENGTAIADQYVASLGLNLSDFCCAFQKVLDHYFDGELRIELNPLFNYTKGVQYMSISYSYIWDVLQQIYEVYGVRWSIEGNTIKVGYPSDSVSHIFEYGYEGGLLSIERQVQDTNIRNSLLGRGGEKNLPAYYFKEAPKGSLFDSDPDWIPELANIYFSNLRGKTFRDYIKGWKAKHYGGAVMNNPTEAYTKGYTDTKFSPIEYVEDKESIEKYGLLQGALENNDSIYPSIQGAPNGEDVVVYVEPTYLDSEVQPSDGSIISNIDGVAKSIDLHPMETKSIELRTTEFEIPEDRYGHLTYYLNEDVVWKDGVADTSQLTTQKSIVWRNLDTSVDYTDTSHLTQGRYVGIATLSASYGEGDEVTPATALVTLSIEQIKLQIIEDIPEWKYTFDIWVKNIWGSKRDTNESAEAYAERVWRPILGDRQGGEAKVCFSSGWLSGHEDYEFTIVDFAFDDSHEYNGAKSEWRLTLKKSDAELEATGKYIPSASTNGQAHAGDTFFFVGIDMPYQYVLWAEERLDNYKIESLNEVSEIQPKWVVRFDKLRLNQLNDDEQKLIDQIKVGGIISIADARFIEDVSISLYVSSITYLWDSQTKLYPNIEVVLSDKPTPTPSPVAQIQSSINALSQQISGMGNIAEIVRTIGDMLYLRKDGTPDTSRSATKFVNLISGHKFRQGKFGGADWAIYRDKNNNAVAEFDKLIVRKELSVNNLVINQISYVGGMQVTSAAAMTVTRVVETEDAYQCFFDQKGGSVVNLFHVNDIAYSQRFDEDNKSVKYYKRLVLAVDVDSITIAKNEVNSEGVSISDGEGIPMKDDNIIQYGNTTDTNRQYVIIRDVIGGGYDRMLSGLNSISATGDEYYFAGRMEGNSPRWFVGDKGKEYIEYTKDGLKIVANITIGPDTDLSKNESLQDALKKAGGNKVFYFPYNDDDTPSKEKPSNYKQGDLWIVQEGIEDAWKRWGAGDIVVAQRDITSAGYRDIDWVKKTKYTDDTAANNALNVANTASTTATAAKNEASNAATAAQQATQAAANALDIAKVFNDDEYLTPSEKRTLRQMMYELSDSEGVAEPYWAELDHSTVVQTDSDDITTSSNPWYIVKNGDKSNGVLQDDWVGWWSSNVAGISNGRNRQIISIDMNNESPREFKLSWASNAEGSYDYLEVESNDEIIGSTKGKQNSIQSKTISSDDKYTDFKITYTKDGSANTGTDAGYYKIEGTDSEFWAGSYQYLCYKGSYPTLYAALYNAGKVDEANELKTRFTAIIDCLQLAEVYGDENSKKDTSLEDVYADFRQDLYNALTEYYNFVEICNLNDVDYLKKVFPNAVLDSNGAVLSQLLAVKDGTGEDAKIVAGLYGGGSYALNKDTGLYDRDIYEDEEQEILSHEGHGALMIFAGANGIDNVESAATRIYEDGTIYTNKLIAEGADISGKITSIEGEIGGFSIGIDSLTTVSSNLPSEVRSKMILNKTGIEFYRYPRTDEYDKRLVIGTSIYSSSGYNGLLSIENKESNPLTNYGISVNVTGGTTNYAIYVPNGLFAGLRPNIRTLTSSDNNKTLTDVDCVVVCNGVTSLYLPSPPQIGQMCIIKKITSANVTIYGNGKNIFLETSTSSIALTTFSALQLHYDGSRWIGGYLVKS